MNQDKWSYYFTLCELGLKDKSAWIPLLKGTKLFTDDEIIEIENYENDKMSSMKELEKSSNARTKILVDEFKEEMEEENPKWVKERRIDYLENEIKALEQEIGKKIGECLNLVKKRKVGFLFIKHLLSSELFRKKEKTLTKLIMELRLKKYGNQINKDQITPEMIIKARNYPIEKLVEVNKRGMARCINPEHQDKNPSMYCKGKNFAYCFVCNLHFDSIDVIMITKGMSFVEAVKRLQ